MPDEKEKQEVEKLSKEKEKERPWWQNLHPIVIGGAIRIGFFIFRGIVADAKNKSNFMFWLMALVAILYILSKTPKAKEEAMVTPKEAELLAERECERKRRWGQFGSMSTYSIGPVAPLQRKDGGGIYYEVAIEVTDPYDRPKFYIATVMAKGPEKGFTTLSESIGPLTGREKVPERTIVPNWFREMEKRPLLEKFYFNK